jgi:hypothetical protein
VLVNGCEHTFDIGILILVEFADFTSVASLTESCELFRGDETGLEGVRVWLGCYGGEFEVWIGMGYGSCCCRSRHLPKLLSSQVSSKIAMLEGSLFGRRLGGGHSHYLCTG